MRWRTGRKNGHTMYTQNRVEPQDDDLFVGSVVDSAYAALAVQAVNAVARIRQLHDRYEDVPGRVFCSHCTDYSGDMIPWPCPTMKIMEDE